VVSDAVVLYTIKDPVSPFYGQTMSVRPSVPGIPDEELLPAAKPLKNLKKAFPHCLRLVV